MQCGLTQPVDILNHYKMYLFVDAMHCVFLNPRITIPITAARTNKQYRTSTVPYEMAWHDTSCDDVPYEYEYEYEYCRLIVNSLV